MIGEFRRAPDRSVYFLNMLTLSDIIGIDMLKDALGNQVTEVFTERIFRILTRIVERSFRTVRSAGREVNLGTRS
jgi:hypothetical protein